MVDNVSVDDVVGEFRRVIWRVDVRGPQLRANFYIARR